LAVVVILAPTSTSTVGYISMIIILSKIAAWVIGPTVVLAIITGLWAMALNPAFQDAGWVWAKAATGILILLGGLHVLGPIQEEAKRGAGALARSPDPASVSRLLTAEGNTLLVLLAVSVANIALGVWRPRLPKIPI
jgi:hypothetical protein